MESKFGSLMDHGPTKHLESKGYKLGRDWHWTHPVIKDVNQMEQFDWQCLLFLIQEWDYGGLRA